ncbi:alcohol dehydrogenase [Prauserella marina]|uniref:Alcohol dehydrogenase, class IV n=1 Tax=Prauserella marina TaxID=530584 RepID=A0A222VMV9_9PSEU|nr:iron-containing alcohol dehydrogenase [Prauserella marina]ASR35249.1 alcohol dehydrogenase [Prauserella marina]PWV84975.1 alcohol dehydrogenase class IV [Prauserella marina]SDC07862.1 Alcohol dehydrogenase, class IV [Prauserella marina]
MSGGNELGLGLLRQPSTVLFGPGQRRQLPALVAAHGDRALLCTDERMAGEPVFHELAEAMRGRGIEVSVYSKVEPDLPRGNLLDVAEVHAGARFDVVVGIGGGSVLDFAKLAAILLARGGDVGELYGENMVPGPGSPLITVPTTAGTGAEVTCISVVFDPDKGMKIGVASPHLEAAAAVIDPELTLTCPPGLTTATGADALSHLVEAFTGRAKNPSPREIEDHLYIGKNLLTDLYCREGLALVNTSFARVVADPSDLGARADTMRAAFSAGMAINTAGTAGAHAIQSPIGALTHTAHGLGVGALLPYVMRFNLPERVAEFAEIGRILGVATQEASPEAQAHEGIRRIEDLLGTLGCPLNLKDLGLEPRHFDKVAEQALLATRLTANNPRELDHGSIVAILERGYADDRSPWTV